MNRILWRSPICAIVTVTGLSLGVDTCLAVPEGSKDARDVVKQGTMEFRVVSGFWQATTAVGHAQSANRSAALVLPPAGLVVTDSLGSGWWEGNVELLLRAALWPVYAPVHGPGSGGRAGRQVQPAFLRAVDALLGCWRRDAVDQFGSTDSRREHAV
jgi:hypothetical protein